MSAGEMMDRVKRNPSTDRVGGAEQLRVEEERVFLASQWKLMWWKFTNHKLAVISTLLLLILYLIALFCEFIAPYDPMIRDSQYVLMPPQTIRFFGSGGFHLRPFVYAKKMHQDPETLIRKYIDDTSHLYSLRFFVHGQPYRMWNLISLDLHLFGTENGAVYLFGTDALGRDLFSQIVYGARVSLTIGLVGVFMSLILGLLIGGVAGFMGGLVDGLIQRLIEIIRSFPTIPLWMGLSAALPNDWSPLLRYFGITIILSLIGWTTLARVARGQILSLRGEDFVLAARTSGASTMRIIGVHLIPSFTSYIIASLTLSIPRMILGETSLSFLGLGLREPIISWGVLLSRAQNIHSVVFTPWLLIPGVFVVVTILCFNFLGDGLRDAADPYVTANR